MAQVGDSAHTPHGLGQITEIVNERGRLSFRVAGRGFNIWTDETKLHVANGNMMSYPLKGERECPPGKEEECMLAQMGGGEGGEIEHFGGLESTIDPGDGVVNRDNSTTLPYNWEPQNHADLFRKDQNILPGEFEIDADDRLHPSDSLSGDSRTDVSGPRPSPGLFAHPGTENPFADERTSSYHYADGPRHEKKFWMGEWHGPGKHEKPEGPRHAKPPTRMVPMDEVEYQSYINDDPKGRGGQHETWNMPKGKDTGAGYHPDKPFKMPNISERNPDQEQRVQTGNYRPAGLSDRYAHFEVEATDQDSPVARFRRDPIGFLRLCGHMWTDGDDSLDFKYADYNQLIDVDPSMRQAAWSDVRSKAMRLRREGKVNVNDHGLGRIYATVQGDNGTYDVMIVKVGGGQSVTDWACSCDWGKWAFKRQMSYVGRLCSHGYATYLEMQARDIGPEHFKKKTAGVKDHYRSWLDEMGLKHTPRSVEHYLNQQPHLNFGEGPEGEAIREHLKAASVEDYKTWLKENDQAPEPSSIASYLNTTALNLDQDDVRELYDYAEDNSEESRERDFKIPYTNDPDVAYKTAGSDWSEGEEPEWKEYLDRLGEDEPPAYQRKKKADRLLRTRPRGLVPDLHPVPEGEDEHFVDVTKSDQETTAPDQIVHFSSADTLRRLHAQPIGTSPMGAGTGGVALPDMSTGVEGTRASGGAAPIQATPEGSSTTPVTSTMAALHTAAPNDPDRGDMSDWLGGIFRGTDKPRDEPAEQPKDDDRFTMSDLVPNLSLPGDPGYKEENPDEDPDENPPDRVAEQPGPAHAPRDPQGIGALPPAAPAPGVPAPTAPGGPGDHKSLNYDPTPGVAPGQTPGVPQQDPNSAWKANPGLDKDKGTNQINTTDYKVQRGDTLNTILQRTYGDQNVDGMRQTVLDANKDITNPDLIQTDSMMKLPDADKYDALTGAKSDKPLPPGPAVGTDLTTQPPSPTGASDPQAFADLPPAAPAPAPNSAPDAIGTPPPGQTGLGRETPATPMQQGANSVNPMQQGADASTRTLGSSLRYAETSDSSLLDHLRDLSTSCPDDDLGHMDDHNDELRDLVDELRDRGYDASFMVASIRDAERHEMDPTQADPSFLGLSGPDWADMGAEGSGPSPKDWFASSEDYVEDHERPHHEEDWYEGEGDIIKFNDSRSKPQQGPGKSSSDHLAANLHRSGRGPVSPPRIDPGPRQPDRPHYASAPPEDFGYDGGADAPYQATPAGGDDIVAAFHRSGAADAMMRGPDSSDGDISRSAQAFLRTAGRKYSPEEQRELEAEFHPQGARNLPDDDDLAGTHYLLL